MGGLKRLQEKKLEAGRRRQEDKFRRSEREKKSNQV